MNITKIALDYLNVVREKLKFSAQNFTKGHTLFKSTNLIIIMTVEKSAWKRDARSFFIQFFCLPSLAQYTQLLKQPQAVCVCKERERDGGTIWNLL